MESRAERNPFRPLAVLSFRLSSKYEFALFLAACVAAIEDETGWVVGLADREHDTNQYLQFQRGHVRDSQDKELGHDTYYVEKDDQSNSCYGRIESVDLGPNVIRLKLDEARSQSLVLDKNVLITFDADEYTPDRFRQGLEPVFVGTGLIPGWSLYYALRM